MQPFCAETIPVARRFLLFPRVVYIDDFGITTQLSVIRGPLDMTAKLGDVPDFDL